MIEQILDIFTLHGVTSLISLTALEIILGIDNIVFIALIIQHLPKKPREHARRIGLTLALGLRVILLLSIAWVLSLTKPWFTVFAQEFSGKDILLILGGLFLIYKATTSMHDMFTDADERALRENKSEMTGTIIQIMFIDLVFSFDSVITAVGLTQNIPIIVVAMSIAMLIMLFFTGFVSDFIMKHPSLKTLAISFILLIGVILIGEGFGLHVPRGYLYFAMAFSAAVETMNILIRNKKHRE
jgi:predicted tellurium resistance membrane protein TerC